VNRTMPAWGPNKCYGGGNSGGTENGPGEKDWRAGITLAGDKEFEGKTREARYAMAASTKG